ncbi:MAG: lipid II flippase Amj family protein [Bacilli bacterium]
MELITTKLIIIFGFILLIHTIETLAYAVRLSGARVKLLASGLSLFNMMVVVSRMANMMQQPFTGSLIDHATEQGTTHYIESQFRILIGASSVGTLVGIVLMPTFIALFSRAIILLEKENGSVPALTRTVCTTHYVKRIFPYIRIPRRSFLKGIRLIELPKRLFFLNFIVTAVYTIGVLSALYASVIAPEYKTTAIMASGLINGIATILLSVFIDPKISVTADRVVNGDGNYQTLKGISIMMVASRFLGTIFAQALFIPGAVYIAWMAGWIA